MKIDFIADTNFLIYVHQGNSDVENFLGYNIGISFITEVELLSYSGITDFEEAKLKSLISDCYLIDWSVDIKEQTIQLKRKYKIKLPDAIIASTCLVHGITLVSADKGFSKIEGLSFVQISI